MGGHQSPPPPPSVPIPKNPDEKPIELSSSTTFSLKKSLKHTQQWQVMLSGLAPLSWDLSTEYLTQISEQVNQRIKNILSYHIEDDKHAYLLYST